MSRGKIDPESAQFIHERYQDTAILIFQRNQRRGKDIPPQSPRVRGAESAEEYSHLGNQPVRIEQAAGKGVQVSDSHDDRVQSQFCTIM